MNFIRYRILVNRSAQLVAYYSLKINDEVSEKTVLVHLDGGCVNATILH
jgi:hypothetical protein